MTQATLKEKLPTQNLPKKSKMENKTCSQIAIQVMMAKEILIMRKNSIFSLKILTISQRIKVDRVAESTENRVRRNLRVKILKLNFKFKEMIHC